MIIVKNLLIVLKNQGPEADFPHKLLLTNRQVANLLKAFANNFSANIKLFSKIIQSGAFPGRPF